MTKMISQAFDDFIDDCFISGDDVCKFEIYKTRRYEKKNNCIASDLIAGINTEKGKLYKEA